MAAPSPHRALFGVFFFSAILSTAACVHPLGPGYHFPDRQADIAVAGSSPGTIHIRVTDTLINAGNRPLRSLDVRLPESANFGERNLRMQIEGVEISPERSSPIDARMMSAPFEPVWREAEKRTIVTEWELSPSERGTIGASPDGFFIADETAFPLWQTPRGIFARGGTFPDKQLLTIRAPKDFRVLANGKPLKQTSENGDVVRRYLIDPTNDFVPYVVAGKYQESVIPSRQGSVQFWTFGALDTGAAIIAAKRLAASFKAFQEFFGSPVERKISVRVVQAPEELPSEFSDPGSPGAASFPEGALLGPRAMQKGIADEEVLRLAEYELARTWYGWRVRPRPEAQILMGRGIGLFGLVITAEARAPVERAKMVSYLLQQYDAARAAAPDKRLMEPPAGYSRAERISTGYRGALFFVALEDFCGRDALRTALRDIIQARALSDTGYEELRATLESNSGKDLADMFRAWLVQPGIPEEFRDRYRSP